MSVAINLAIPSTPTVTTGGDSTRADPPSYAGTANTVDGDAVVDDNNGDDNALLPPTIYVLAGQTIHAESAAAAPLYQLHRGVASLSDATAVVTLERIERTVPRRSADAAANTAVRQRVRHIYNLRHLPPRAPGGLEALPSDAPRFFIQAASQHALGTPIGLKKARFRTKQWLALPVEGAATNEAAVNKRGLPQFRKHATPLFEVRQRRGRYEWTGSSDGDEREGKDGEAVALHPVAVEDEGEGDHRLVVTVALRRPQLDALVALWCCRLWAASAAQHGRVHEGMEGVRRKFRLAREAPGRGSTFLTMK